MEHQVALTTTFKKVAAQDVQVIMLHLLSAPLRKDLSNPRHVETLAYLTRNAGVLNLSVTLV